MKIKLTEFALRHFDKTFGGTKILDMTPEDFEKEINLDGIFKALEMHTNITIIPYTHPMDPTQLTEGIKVMDGYAPFCKLLAIRNFTDAKVGSMPITVENYIYLRSGYSARRESELPVSSRWLELPLRKPKAEWLVLVLYDKKQIEEESMHNAAVGKETFKKFEADWGIVAILGQNHPNEEPMKPETMLRNALGVEEGGSGVALDREKYLESVDFWSENATVK